MIQQGLDGGRDGAIKGVGGTLKESKNITLAGKYPGTLKAFTTALSQGQQIADTDRAATEAAIEKYLGIPEESAAFISLPAFPLGVDAVRLQRVVSAMSRFGLLPRNTPFKVTSMIGG